MRILHNRSPREFCGKTYTPIVDATNTLEQGISTPAELWAIVLLASRSEHKQAVTNAFTNAFMTRELGLLARKMLGYTAHMGGWRPIPAQALPPDLVLCSMLMNQIFPGQQPPSQPPLIQYALAPRANRFLQLLLGSVDYLYFSIEGVRNLERELYAIT